MRSVHSVDAADLDLRNATYHQTGRQEVHAGIMARGRTALERRSATLTANGGATLAELEKQFTVTTGADRAFEYLSDPVRLPEWVSTMRLEESTAVEGELDVDADLKDRDGAPSAGFVADRATRRIGWGRPDRGYGGSIAIAPGTTNTSSVVLRLQTRDDADAAEVARIFEQSVSNIRRLLSGR